MRLTDGEAAGAQVGTCTNEVSPLHGCHVGSADNASGSPVRASLMFDFLVAAVGDPPRSADAATLEDRRG